MCTADLDQELSNWVDPQRFIISSVERLLHDKNLLFNPGISE
jgi:hypothetical protein